MGGYSAFISEFARECINFNSSAFVFGFVHVMISVLSGNISEWIQIFSYFFMGAALSYLYEKRNNIYVPILSHAMNNFIAMLLMIF